MYDRKKIVDNHNQRRDKRRSKGFHRKGNRKSKKRQEIDAKEYAPAAKQFREDHPFCEINAPGVCTGQTQGVNHKKGKATIELLMDQEFWEAGCNPCNQYCEANSEWAEKNGHKIPDYNSKLSKIKSK